MRITALAVTALFGIITTPSAFAQVVTITQAKALAGNVTPGDTAGYPVTITQPGAYRLDSNLIVPSGQIGIVVNVDAVDLDMNGFLMTGNGAGSYAFVSNRASGRIHGGSVTRFSGSGIYLRGIAWTIEDMKIMNNGGIGIDATAAGYLTVRDSLVAANGSAGITTGNDARIERNTVSENMVNGINCEANCYVDGNSIRGNRRAGVSPTSGLLLNNIIAENVRFGLDSRTPDNVGVANNLFINNTSPVGTQNDPNGKDVNPNLCLGVFTC